MKIYYLEVVTPDVAGVCNSYQSTLNLEFSEPDAVLGNARVAMLQDGCLLGVRAPMNDAEPPVTRPYWLVENISEAVRAAEKAGCHIALPPMELPGKGVIAIYLQGDTQHGFWQL